MQYSRKPISTYWASEIVSPILARINHYEREKSYRPTVVVPIIDYAGRPLLVRMATKEGNWGLVQGHIDSIDADPVAACRREAFEEADVTDEKIECVYPFLLDESMDKEVRAVETGFTKGGYYICVGIKLKAGADVSVEPPAGIVPSIVERRWCSSLDQAISILREQPGVEPITSPTAKKIERVLIPALENMYQPHAEARSEILTYDYI